jgi:iron complex transport system ATP-binding protein
MITTRHMKHRLIAARVRSLGAAVVLALGARPALAQEPLLLLLDEPTAFLDVPSRVELMGLLRRLARDRQLAVVVSTHDLELALRSADTVWLIMPDGRLHAGTPEDIVADGRVEEAFT